MRLVGALGGRPLALLALALAACAGGDASAPHNGRDTATDVHVERVDVRPIERMVSAVGTLAAQEQSVLSSKVAGRLQRFAVDIGSVVHQGDLLAQVEPRDYELRVQQATAALAQARAELGLPLEGAEDEVTLEDLSTVRHARAMLDEAGKNRDRIRSLADSGIASSSDVDTVESRFTVAQSGFETALEDARMRTATLAQRRAELEIARKSLADTSVLAPFDGAVQARPASVGQFLAAGTPVLTLVKADPLRLRLEVAEREATSIEIGQEVRLQIEGDTQTYRGRIARISPALDEQSRTLRVEADVPRRGALRPGLFARAEIVIDEREPVVCVPANALTSFAGIEKVVLVDEGAALERVVTTGRRAPDCVEVVSGLEAGATVVLDPGGLQTGQPLRVVEDTDPSSTTG